MLSRFRAARAARNWHRGLRLRHPDLQLDRAYPCRLRLVLGVGRSGTTWIAKVLAHTEVPCRFFSEPLFHIDPALPFHDDGDHTAAAHVTRFGSRHPLSTAYSLLTTSSFDTRVLMRPAVLERDDPEWQFCLVKEVHALLATEALLRAWSTPTVFVLRNPLYALDSLFAVQGLTTIYLDHEVAAVQEPAFLNAVVPGRQEVVRRLFEDTWNRDARARAIGQKLICIELVQQMFEGLSRELDCSTAVWYEKCCEAPGEELGRVAARLGIPWDCGSESFLLTTTRADLTSGDPYSIVRNTAAQPERPFTFLMPEELGRCGELLEALRA